MTTIVAPPEPVILTPEEEETLRKRRRKNRWRTPPEIFNFLDGLYRFTIDGAADAKAAKCSEWFGPGSELEEDAFAVSGAEFWMAHDSIFCNPPYSRDNGGSWTAEWVELMHRWSLHGASTVVGLVNADTSTGWWHDIARDTCSEIWLTSSRVHFIDPDTEKPVKGNRMGSAILIWQEGRTPRGHAPVYSYDWREGKVW